jgi:hypothetical protein
MGQLYRQTPLITHVYIIFFIRDTFLHIFNLFGQRSFPLGGNKLSKSSVVGVHGNLYADLNKHSYESKTENPK